MRTQTETGKPQHGSTAGKLILAALLETLIPGSAFSQVSQLIPRPSSYWHSRYITGPSSAGVRSRASNSCSSSTFDPVTLIAIA